MSVIYGTHMKACRWRAGDNLTTADDRARPVRGAPSKDGGRLENRMARYRTRPNEPQMAEISRAPRQTCYDTPSGR